MKAMLSVQPGGPETLTLSEAPDPVAGPGEVVVQIRACGVNFPDTLIIEDKYQFKPPRPFAPGGEFAGVVESLGEGVNDLKVGDPVIAQTISGGMAEKIAVPAAECVLMPDGMPFGEGAAFLFTFGTSYYALKQRAKLKPGESLLVLGAAGGVGLAAVELGKAMGAHVIAAASTQDKVDLALHRGADVGVVYPRGPFDKDGCKALAALFKGAAPKDGVDVVYDAVGGDYAEAALRALAWEGRLLVVGFPAGIPSIPLNLPLLKSCQIVGVFYGAFTTRDPETSDDNKRDLLSLYANGKIRPYISATYPLDQAGAAIAELAERRAKGKVVVAI